MDRKHERQTYAVDYRNIKYPRLEFKTGTLLLVLPKDYQDETQILAKHQEWISKKRQTIQEALKQAETKRLDHFRKISELKALGSTLLQQHQAELKTTINKVIYRKMNTKWASHSQSNNLTINTLLKYLPESLVEYIFYHELTHAKRGRKHDREFWKTIDKKFKDYRERENDLLVYWFLIQENQRKVIKE